MDAAACLKHRSTLIGESGLRFLFFFVLRLSVGSSGNVAALVSTKAHAHAAFFVCSIFPFGLEVALCTIDALVFFTGASSTNVGALASICPARFVGSFSLIQDGVL